MSVPPCSLDSGRTRSASVTPSAAGISRFCSIMLGRVGVSCSSLLSGNRCRRGPSVYQLSGDGLYSKVEPVETARAE